VAGLAVVTATAVAQAPAPTGTVQGTAWAHDATSLAAVVQEADVVLPAAATGGEIFVGKFKDLPAVRGGKVPVVLFMHGSSGLGLKAIGEWQRWLATLGVASVAPNSFALPGRVTYTSPIDRVRYERIHALRLSEIAPSLKAVQGQAWADPGRLVLAGASEGGVPVARYPGNEFAARMVYSWSCEPNYFVEQPTNAFEPGKPVLNVISLSDPFFSRSNSWLDNDKAKGHCGDALKGVAGAAVALIPDAPHTLLNLPAARHATAGFLAALARP
jgi:dienelactone hydrolase